MREKLFLQESCSTLVQREIAKIWTNCSNFEESMRFGTQVVLNNTKRFSYSAKLILLFNGYFGGKILLFWRKIARNWKMPPFIYLLTNPHNSSTKINII